MKKLILWLIAVIAIITATDITFGYAAKTYIKNHPLRGDYRNSDHLINDSIENIIVLGSSVALNSIETKVLSDSLGKRAYNGGSNGQTFPFYLTLMEILADKPGIETIILGMHENALTDSGLGTRYNLLVPYYHSGYAGIDARLESQSPLHKHLLKSSLYRYNTIWFRILLYMFVEPGVKGELGFVAKDIPAYFPNKITPPTLENHVTAERADEFEQFVALCNSRSIRLIVCIPPRFEEKTTYNAGEEFLKRRASKGDFELWFDVEHPAFSSDSTLFFDNVHLNYVGARQYTDIIVNRLNKNKNEYQD